MIPTIRPSTKFLSEEFKNAELIYIVDHMPEPSEVKIYINNGRD
jgi:hypothetical protein